MAYFTFLLCLSHILLRLSLTSGIYYCYNSGNFTSNSSYGESRDLLLAALSSNITAHNGFYTTTVGQFPDEVHGLALCRGDYSSDSCYRCVNSSNEELIQGCPYQKQAITWGTMDSLCIVRFSESSITGVMQTVPHFRAWNAKDVTMNFDEFYEVWNGLINNLVTEAVMSSSGLKFATGEAAATSSIKVYAMVQCTPDLSRSDCRSCLRSAVGVYQNCCHGKGGTRIQTPSCIFRFELYPFYNSTTEAPQPSPPPPPPPPPPPVNLSPLNPTTSKGKGISTPALVVIIIVPVVLFWTLVAVLASIFPRKINPNDDVADDIAENEDATNGEEESFSFDFAKIRAATNDFSDANKLGQGGFGPVYQGRLSNGLEIAVKRLQLRSCGQGELEFKNEIVLMARLSHRNLVRLLGFCFEGRERLLIYEFLPHSSLDRYIFDPIKRLLLDWERRYKIIIGIARGILYLHEDCPLRIIHHDLKAGNILLDGEMNPKISDFGVARIFAIDQSKGKTKRIAGTYGYMPPEYVKNGQFSVKTDVFSFGVLTLEIISGKKISFNNSGHVEHLLSYAWKNWRKGSALNLMDPILRDKYSTSEIMKCIHIGLLCVQENVVKRPTMASVVLMLNEESASLPLPSQPGFFIPSGKERKMSLHGHHSQVTQANNSSSHQTVRRSVNNASITELNPR